MNLTEKNIKQELEKVKENNIKIVEKIRELQAAINQLRNAALTNNGKIQVYTQQLEELEGKNGKKNNKHSNKRTG